MDNFSLFHYPFTYFLLNRGINLGGENPLNGINLVSLLDWGIKWIICFSLDVRLRKAFQIQLLQFPISLIDWMSWPYLP